MALNLEDVFVTEGVPKHTFVRPPNYADILLDLRRPGKPVIIEGQSGTGKTTTIKRIIQDAGIDGATYLSARNPADIEAMERMALERPSGLFVLDDFHRLSASLREHLADIAKLSAEQGDASLLPKVVIIGINQVGSDLIQLVPDIAKRTGIHRIQPGTEAEITDLIRAGCEKLFVEFSDMRAIVTESRGDYWLTQQLCQTICAIAGVMTSQEAIVRVAVDLTAVRVRVVTKLQAAVRRRIT